MMQELISSNSIHDIVAKPQHEQQQQGKTIDDQTLATESTSDSDWDDSFVLERNVRFSNAVMERTIESHESYSPQERDQCWYTADENDDMMMAIEEQVARINAGLLDENDKEEESTYRGLNALTVEGQNALQSRILALWDTVLDEQYQQYMSGEWNDEWLAEISRLESKDCVLAALYLARQDAEEAAQCYQ